MRRSPWIGAAALALCAHGAQAAECTQVVPLRQFAQQVSGADQSYAAMDEMGFRNAQSESRDLIACLGEGITGGQVAAFHRVMALGHFLDRNHAGSVASFKSVLAAAPGYALPETLAPPNHPLRIHFEVAEGSPAAPGLPLPAPRQGRIKIDGAKAESAPSDRGYIFQHFDENGEVMTTRYVDIGDPLPDYAAKGRPGDGPGVNIPLAVTAGVATVTSGALYFAARSSEKTFWNPDTDPSELEGLKKRANTMGWMSAGFGVVAVGAGAGMFLAGTW